MSLIRRTIQPPNPMLDAGPRLGLPMSAGVQAGPLIFLSGIFAVDPATGARWHGSAIQEARMALSAMKDMLEAHGSSMASVVKLHVFLYSMLELDNINKVCRDFFPGEPPARTACGVTLIDGAKVEFDCVALAGAPA